MTEELINFLKSDDAIFHYTKKETAMEYILNNKQLQFGSYYSTNDPYEYKKRLTSAFGWGDINQSLYIETMHLIDNIINQTPFLSFCANSNNSGYDKPRMWSQYGQNHSGICLVFSRDSFMTTIKNELSKNYLIYDENINYKEIDFNSINIYDSDLTANQIVMNNIKKDYKNIFFQKHLDYKDEDEFRVVLIQKDENVLCQNPLVDISNSLKLIILGDKFPEVYLPTIKDLSRKLNMKFKRFHWEQNQYFLLND